MDKPLTPRRILYLHPTADNYGGTKILLEIIEELPHDQFHPIVILPVHGPLEKIFSDLKIEYHILPITVIRRGSVKGLALLSFLVSILPNTIRLALFIKKNKIDLVHTQTMVVLTGALSAKLAGVPHIWHIHEIVSEEFPKLWKYYCQLVVRLSTKVICTSNVTASQFPDRSKVTIIPNGIDLKLFDAGMHKSHPALLTRQETGQINIAVIGRVSPRKGQAYLLDTFITLLKRVNNFSPHLFIIGDIFPGYEYYLQELRTRVSECGLESRVIFTGFIEDMAAVYPCLDIIVVPSLLPEGFGLVVLEAMACRIPVIATAHGGPLETIEDKISGLLVPPDDPAALIEAMDYLIGHPDERTRLAEGGYQRAEQFYSIEITTALTLQTYREILAI